MLLDLIGPCRVDCLSGSEIPGARGRRDLPHTMLSALERLSVMMGCDVSHILLLRVARGGVERKRKNSHSKTLILKDNNNNNNNR